MYLGVDIGGTKTLVAVLDADGVITERAKFPTPEVYEDFLRRLADTVASLTTKDFRAACVAVPGRIDRKHGRALGYGNLPWPPESVLPDIEKIVGCPTLIENDANLAGLSEAMLLKDRFSRVLYVTISTGIGGGYVVGQRLDPGMLDSEIGQLELAYKGKLTPWEDFASGRAIVERYGKRAADIEDPATWKRIARDLALGFVQLIAVIQPEVIVIGGSVGSYLPKYKRFLEAELQKYGTPLVPTPAIVQAGRPEEAVVYGCYDLIKQTYAHLAR